MLLTPAACSLSPTFAGDESLLSPSGLLLHSGLAGAGEPHFVSKCSVHHCLETHMWKEAQGLFFPVMIKEP